MDFKEYKKNFDAWNECQKIIDAKKSGPPCREGEIWWCSIGINIGSEQDGKNEQFERPALIVLKINKNVVWILPLSSKIKGGKYRASLETLSSEVILSQIRTISTKRIIRRICRISDNEMNGIVDRFVALLPQKKDIKNETKKDTKDETPLNLD
jgi:mRNA-degrading endonuclease toxin of MazEF toxin-antitoxin module